MNIKNISRQRGFLEIITIIVIGVALLAYFNVDLHAIVNDPLMQKMLGVLKSAWFNYLLPLWAYLKGRILGLFN